MNGKTFQALKSRHPKGTDEASAEWAKPANDAGKATPDSFGACW
jgi:hypothetical protein